jgi:sensor histidine kinase YesM
MSNIWKKLKSLNLKNINLIKSLIILDVIILVLHLIFERYALFNLDREGNIPTIYQGFKTLSFGFFFLFNLYFIKYDTLENLLTKKTFFWIFISAFFIFLGIDELAMVHENLPSYLSEFNPEASQDLEANAINSGYNGATWLLYYLPIFVLIFGFLMFNFRIIKKYLGKISLYYLLALFCIILVPLVEAINTSGVSPQAYNIWITVEEFLEMIAISILGWVYFKLWQKNVSPDFEAWANRKLKEVQ